MSLQSGMAMARTGLRRMPTCQSPPPRGHFSLKSPGSWGQGLARVMGPGGRGLGSDGSHVDSRPASRRARADRLSDGAATVAGRSYELSPDGSNDIDAGNQGSAPSEGGGSERAADRARDGNGPKDGGAVRRGDCGGGNWRRDGGRRRGAGVAGAGGAGAPCGRAVGGVAGAVVAA
jgi:hypothetical protein